MQLPRSAVLGGVDGVITSFAVVAACSVADDSSARVALIVGTSSILADGVSMGIAEFLSFDEDQNDTRHFAAYLSAIACFTAFVIGGSIPLLTYATTRQNLMTSVLAALLELSALGMLRSSIAKQARCVSLLQTVSLGSFAGGVAYVAARVAALVS